MPFVQVKSVQRCSLGRRPMQLACSRERHLSSHVTVTMNSRASPGLFRIAFWGAEVTGQQQHNGRYARHFSCRTRSKRLSVMEATNRGHSPWRLEISALNALHGALLPALPPPMMQRSSTRPAHVNTLGSSRNGSSCNEHQLTARGTGNRDTDAALGNPTNNDVGAQSRWHTSETSSVKLPRA
jgi:hypothetical protein